MNIKRIYALLREFSYLKKTLRQYGGSLVPGRYHLFRTMRSLCCTDEESMAAARPYFDKNGGAAGKLSGLVDRLNRKGYFCNRNPHTSGEYEAMYTANNYDRVREVKLFSFKGKRILTIPVSRAARDAALQEYQALSSAHPMPPVRAKDTYENAYEIAMVSLLPRPEEPAALAAIAAATARASADKAESKTAAQICACRYGQEMDTLLAPLCEAALAILGKNAAVPLMPQHGDLSRDNLLYGEAEGRTDFFWIDWEHLRPRIFFYDYFFYILHTAAYGKDFSPLEAYLSGVCDGHLSALFEALGVRYEPEKRRGYFLLFAVDFLRERVCERGSLGALKMYCDLIGRHLLSDGKDGI